MTLEQLVDAQPLRELTKELYKRSIRDFCAFAGVDPRGWTAAAAMAWRERLVAGDRQTQTVNTHINGLRTASRLWMEYNGNDPRFDFARGVRAGRVVEEASKKHALTYQEATALIGACSGDRPMDLRDHAMAVLGFKTGMRRMSMAALEFERIDWRHRVMTIMVKGGRLHTMPPLDEATFEALAPWRDWLRGRRVTSGRFFRGLPGIAPLAGAPNVRASISMSGIHKVMCGRARAAGLKEFTPHVFRHSFVTWMQMLEMPGYLIQAYTGHKSDAMVIQYTDAWLAAEKRSPMALFQLGGR